MEYQLHLTELMLFGLLILCMGFFIGIYKSEQQEEKKEESKPSIDYRNYTMSAANDLFDHFLPPDGWKKGDDCNGTRCVRCGKKSKWRVCGACQMIE